TDNSVNPENAPETNRAQHHRERVSNYDVTNPENQCTNGNADSTDLSREYFRTEDVWDWAVTHHEPWATLPRFTTFPITRMMREIIRTATSMNLIATAILGSIRKLVKALMRNDAESDPMPRLERRTPTPACCRI
ncbi:NIMA-related serine/threonine kinase 1, partial [Striga asiatica]